MNSKFFNAISKIRYLALLMFLTLITTQAWGDDYELVSTITDGEYVIGAVKGSAGTDTHIYAINNTDNSSWKAGVETTPSGGKISNPASTIVWTLTTNGTNGFSLKNGTKYLTVGTGTGSGTVRANSTTSGTIYYVSTGSNSTFEISGVSTFTISSGNQVGYNIGNGYRQYANRSHSTQTSNGQVSIQFRFYKKATSCSVKPTVGSTLSSVSATTTSITATVPISAIGGCNITENGLVYSTTNSTPTVGGTGCTKVTTTACGSTAANKTVTISGLTCGTTYYVRGYATNAAGTSYTNTKTQSTSACPKYTVTLKDDDTELVQATAGASVTLPSRAGCTGYTFAGWTKSWATAQTTWTTTAPTIISAGSYTPTANENLYPVYTKTEGGGTTTVTKVYSGANTADVQFSTGSNSSSNSLVNNTGYTAGNVNVKFAVTSGTNYSYYDGSVVRYYANNTITITPNSATITKVQFVRSSTTSSNGGVISTTGLTASNSNTSTNTNEYTGSTTSAVTFTNNAQCRFSAINVTYTYSSSTTSYISVPNCCTSLGTINGLVSLTSCTASAMNISWPAVSGGSETGYVVKVYADNNGAKGAQIGADINVNGTESGERVAAISQTTYGLTNNSFYHIGVTPTKTGNYCGTETVARLQYTTCSNFVNLTKGTESHGTFALSSANGSYANCDDNFVVTVSSITPASGYVLNDVTATGGNSTITGPDGSGNYTVTYTKGNNITSTVTANFQVKCATPTFSPAAGTYNNNQTITIDCATDGVTIRYTTNGTTPNKTTGTVGTSVTISANTTIKAIAYKDGCADSEVASATYSFKCATPTMSLASGTYTGTQNVTLSCATTSSVIHYTTDGTTPTGSSPTYSSAISVSDDMTIKAIAVKTDYTNSDVAEATYSILNCDWYESFSGCDGTGGNDDSWSGTGNDAASTDNDNWTLDKANAASGCIKLGSGSYGGSAQTPALTDMHGTLTIKFRAGAWNGGSENTTLSISATNGTLSASSVTLTKGAWTNYSITLENVDEDTKITFYTSSGNSRFFLDDVCIKASCDNRITLTASAGANGAISFKNDFSSPTTSKSICTDGGSQSTTVYVKPADGYQVADITTTVGTIGSITDEGEGVYSYPITGITGSGAKTVSVSFEAKPKYTVSFNIGTGKGSAPSSKTEATAGAGITLPAAATPSDACAADGWTFAGWCATNVSSATDSKPTLYAAGDTYYPISNCTLYSVYKQTEAGGGGCTITFDDNGSNANSSISGSGIADYATTNECSATFSPNDKVYKGTTGLKFSSSSELGSLTIRLPESAPVSSVIVNAKVYDSDASGVEVSVGETSYGSQSLTASLADYEFSGSETSDEITIDAVTKRIYVKSITIASGTTYYHTSPSCVACTKTPSFSFADGGTVNKTTDDDAYTNALTVTNKHANQTVRYTSSNTSVATVNAETGEVTIHSNGSTTITASVLKYDIYCASSGSYTLNVTIPTYDVEWNVSGSAIEHGDKWGTTFTTSVTKGYSDPIVLPNAPVIADCDGSKVFRGWVTAPILDETDTDPSGFTTAGGAPTISKSNTVATAGNRKITFYAVFATLTVGGGSDYVKVTTSPSDWSGDWLIVNEQYLKVFNGGDLAVANTPITISDIEENTIPGSAELTAAEFTIEKDGDDFYVYAKTAGKYITDATGNGGKLVSNATKSAGYKNNVGFYTDGDAYIEGPNGKSLYYNSGSPRFNYYGSEQKYITLYRKQTSSYTGFITRCTNAYTVKFSINGVIDPNNDLSEDSEGAGVLRSAFPSVAPATNPTGWTFSHWSESVNGTAAISTSGSPAKYFPSHNITLYAVWSKTVDAETTYRSNVCVSPLTGLTLNAAGNVKAKRADLSWAAVANADKYLLEYKIDGSDSWSSKELVTTSTTLTGLTDNKTYQWRVTALPTAGSQYCEIVANGTSFTTEPYIPGTISLIPGSGTCAVSTLTGDEVVLPSASASCEELAFVGWTTKTGWNNQTTGTKLPDPLYKAGDKILTEDIVEIYAVYRVGEGGDGQYEHILTAAGLAEGAKVVIVGSSDTYNTNAIKQYVSGSYMPSAEVTISASKITSASVESSGAAVWTIGKIVDGGNTYYTFKDQSNRYLTSNTSETSNYLAAAAAETPDMYARWTIEVTNASEGNMLIKCAGKNDYDYIRFNSGSPRFNCYKSSSGVVPATLWIYKKAEASTYLHSQTTCVECQSVASLAKNSVTAVMSVPNEAIANPNPLINPNSGAQTWSSSNPDIATVNASTGALTLKAEGDVIITVKQAKSITSGEARCKVDLSYNLHIKSPSLEVIDWERNTVVVESDIQLNLNVPPSDPNYTTISAGELNEVRSNVATELFFSKYFEASANVKMLGIYNGTLEPIDLSKYRIRSYSDDNTKAHIILFSEYDHVPSILEESQEAIFYSHQWNSNDQEILECAEEETDMSGWYCIPAKTEDNPTGKYTWYATSKSVTFGGKEVITLQKNTGTAESPVWTTIDIIGSTYADGTKDNRQLRTPSWGDADGWVANDGKEYGTGNTIGLSTNRCLLIRNLDVKNGANAVAKNITDADNGFATLAEEWTGKHVSNTDANYSSCKNFAYVGGFDYATFYDQYSLLEGSSIQVRDNGTYGVVLDGNINGDYLYNNRCGRINLKIIQGGQEKISKSYKIPIIVRSEASTSDPIFMNAGGSGKGKLTCLTCDVVVRADDNVNYNGDDINSDDEGKLTISKTGVVNMRNLEIYEGGEVIVPNAVTLSVNSLRLRAFNDNSAMLPKITINGTINNTTNTVYMDRRLDDSKYNWITFPYDVNMSDVTFSNGEPATLGTDYYLKYYDGAKRSADVNANPSYYSQSTYWTMVSGDVLKAGQGYILGIPDESNHNHRLEVRFPMTVADINAAESADKSVPVSATEVTIEGRKNDQGWNLIGDPFLLKYRSSQSGLLSGYWEKSMQGSNWDGGWLLNTSNSVPYVTTLNGNDYAQNVLSSTTLQPFTSFFIQAEPGTTAVTFNSSTGRQPWAAPQRAQEDAPERIYAGLLLVNDETLYRDNTALVIGDKFTSSEYVTGADLQKMKGSNQVLVYSLGKNTELAFQAETPERAVSATPLGFRAMKAGDHTFMLDLDFDVRPFEGIYLYDSQERIETNLLYSDYTFSANREENKSRFSIRVEMREKMPTDTDAKIFDDLWTSVQGRDISIGGMPEDAQIYIYDMTGKLIVYDQVNAPVMRYTMPQNGVYNIRIMSAEGKETIKAIVK